MKLAVVGAGSTYRPELVDGLVRMRLLALDAFDPQWPASIVHEHDDAEISVDREALG